MPKAVELLPKFEVTHLPQHGNFGVTDVEAAAEIRLPFAIDLPPLRIIPGFGAYHWSGPQTDAGPTSLRPDMPGATYDMHADIKWRPLPFEWPFVDLLEQAPSESHQRTSVSGGSSIESGHSPR